MDKPQAAAILRPGTAWNMRGNSLEQAEDGTDRVTIPTEGELNAEIAKTAYINKRFLEYPPLRDFADAYYHDQKGNSAPMTAYIDKIRSIKEKYPKPS